MDIAGIRTSGDAEAVGASASPGGVENSLFEIANGSGGEVFRNANDLRSQLETLIAKTNLVYVLAFRPDRARAGRASSTSSRSRCRCRARRVSARPGYYERRGFRRLTPFERNLSAADVIANEIPMDQIPMRVLATPFASGEPAALVPVLLEIPGAPFLAGQKGERATAEIYVYATDAENTLSDFIVQTVGLDLATSRRRLEGSGLKYYGELRLPPGNYRLRALVRNGETGRMGLSVSSLLVPAFADDQPFLLPPVFLEGAGDWVLVRGRRAAAVEKAQKAASPLMELPGEGFAASAEPRVQPGSAARVCLVAYHFGGAEGDQDLRLNGQIIAFDGQPAQEGKLDVLQNSPAERGWTADPPPRVHGAAGLDGWQLRVARVRPGRGGPGPPGMGAVPGSLSHAIVWLLAAASGISPVAGPTPRPAAELSEREREAAIASIHRRAESAAPGAPEARRLSAQLEEIGTVYLDRGEPGRAIELLEEAYALDDGNGAALARLSLAYARVEDLDGAAFYLRVAEERSGGGPPEPYVALGEIFYGSHRLDDSVAAWSEAVRLGGQDPASAAPAGARPRRARRGARPAVAFDRALRGLRGARRSRRVSSAARPTSSRRRTERSRPSSERLSPRARSSSSTAGRALLRAGLRSRLGLGRLRRQDPSRAASQRGRSRPVLSGVLAHELAHALMRQLSGDRAPAWLHEGLAQWLEGRRITRAELRRETGKQAAPSIEDLEGRLPAADGSCAGARPVRAESVARRIRRGRSGRGGARVPRGETG